MVEIDLHAGKVAIVDAQEAVTGVGEAHVRADAQEIVETVDLEQHGELELLGEDLHIDDFGFREAFGDEQHSIGTGGAAFPELERVNQEVFAENWERYPILYSLDV